MVRFAHPEYLYGLTLVPLLGVLFFWVVWSRKRSLRRFGDLAMINKLARSVSTMKRFTKAVLLIVAYVCSLLALANLQIGTRLEEVKQEGVDILLALDVSLSMKAEDIRPNRLEKAKFEIRQLVQKLGGDRIGLIVFAGDAYLQFPLTTDYSAAGLFLDVVDVDAVSTPGTSLGAAIRRAMDSFDFSEPTTKVVIVITDGEETEGDAFEEAEAAKDKGVLLYAIGMGSPTGSPIPLYGPGNQVDFKKDKHGSVVVTKLDEASLEKVARIGNGKYYRATNTQDELNDIYNDISGLEKKEFGVKQFTDYENRFQYFLALGIMLLVIELLLSERTSLWLTRWNPLRQSKEVGT